MSIHILNCAAMSPWFPRWHVGAACLLVETSQGPVLVDTGLGLHDYEHPSPMVRFFIKDFGIHNDPELAAVHQIVRFGYKAQDVQHIVMTHLHFDHAGGLPDFPQARVHVHQQEVEGMLHPRSWIDLAYDPQDFKHEPDWVLYSQSGEKWLGMDAIHLPFEPAMYLIPLFGHTRGHCGVAVLDGEGWVLQCADSIPANAEFDLTPGWMNRLVLGKHTPRLRSFSAAHPEVRLLAGHMWQVFLNETQECSRSNETQNNHP